MSRKTNKTKVETLKPFAKVTFEGDGSVVIEDNFPEHFEGRAALASVLYGAFQAVANEAQKLEPTGVPQIIVPSTEQVAKIAIARS